MTTLRGLGLLVVALGVAGLYAGCIDDASKGVHPGPRAAPTWAGDCDDLPALGGDPGILLGTDWSGEHHHYGDTVVVYACVSVPLGGPVSLIAHGTGIQIEPPVVTVDPSSSGVIPFRVTVSRGASGAVCVQETFGDRGDDLPGPVVAANGDGWHFVPHT